jgi:transposase InsO family protein
MGGSRGRLVTPGDRKKAVELVQEAYANGARKRKACELLEVSVRTLERWESEGEGTVDQRKGADRKVGNKLSKEERSLILNTINSVEYRDLPPCQIVPRLADKGIYIASESTIYRILREAKQLAHRGLIKPTKHKKPEVHEANGPNQLWSWDITFLPSQVRGMYFYLYMIMDIYSRKIVGWTIQSNQSADHAADLIQQACLDEGVERNQIVLHSDNGSPMKGATMLAKLEALGIVPSFSRPSVSDDNPFSEALFKTVKYHPTFPLTDKFKTIFDARTWVVKFARWYNTKHMHSGLKFITPIQRHTGVDNAIMNNRHSVYLKAKEKNPNRWSGRTRSWELPVVVTLNANRKKRVAQVNGQEGLKAII